MTLNVNNAIWLAMRQMRDTWTAYIFTPIYFAFMGAVLATDETIIREFAIPVLMLILVQASISSRYFSFNQDNDVLHHQTFLRSIPIGIGTTIIARAIAMMIAGLINTPVFFMWFWVPQDDWESFPAFLAWVMFWYGMALVGLGISLVQEFSLNLRQWTTMNFIGIMVVIIALAPVFWLTDFRPVSWTAGRAHHQPWLLSAVGIAIGMAGVFAGVRLANRRFRRRDFSQ